MKGFETLSENLLLEPKNLDLLSDLLTWEGLYEELRIEKNVEKVEAFKVAD